MSTKNVHDHYELETKKSLHINLTIATHKEFKIFGFKHGLSMQEMFEEFASRIADGNVGAVTLMEDLAYKKRSKKTHGMSNMDTELLYSVIENGSTND